MSLFEGKLWRRRSDKTDVIRLTRISHTPVVLNSDLIEHIESTPDTVISLTTGQKVVVLESTDEVVRRVIDFRRAVANPLEIQTYLDQASLNNEPGRREPAGRHEGSN